MNLPTLFNPMAMKNSLPPVVLRDAFKVRRLFEETFIQAVANNPKAQQPQLEAELTDRFEKATGHKLIIEQNSKRILDNAEAVAQRLPGTHNTRISVKKGYSLYDLGHEFVHALQNTFDSLQEPLLCDQSTNALGAITFENRSVVNGLAAYYFQFRKAQTPQQVAEIQTQVTQYLQTVSPDARRQVLMYFFEERQAQGLAVRFLKPFTPAGENQWQCRSYDAYNGFLKLLIRVEQALAG